jgi:hypothetical protein
MVDGVFTVAESRENDEAEVSWWAPQTTEPATNMSAATNSTNLFGIGIVLRLGRSDDASSGRG